MWSNTRHPDSATYPRRPVRPDNLANLDKISIIRNENDVKDSLTLFVSHSLFYMLTTVTIATII